MTNLDSIFKSRDITMLTKVHLVKAMAFPVVLYGCENWTIKKAECQRIDAFYLWCWRRLLRIPWTARRSNHSILKAISPEYTAPTPWKQPLRKDLQELLSAQAGKRCSQEVRQASLLKGNRGLTVPGGAGCGSVGDVTGAWLASAPLSPSLWT